MKRAEVKGTAAAFQRSAERDAMLPFVGVAALPELYALEVRGTCLAGIIEDGDRVALSKSQPFERFDIVVVHFKKGRSPVGACDAQLKQIVMLPPPGIVMPYEKHKDSSADFIVVLRMMHPNKMFSVPCSDIEAIHKCIGLLDANGALIPKDFRAA